MSKSVLTCNNEKVLAFYKTHSTLNFERMNVAFVDIMTMLFESANSSLTSNIANQLIEKVEDIRSEMVSHQDSVKNAITLHNMEHLVPLIKECNTSLHDKLVNHLTTKCTDDMQQLITLSISSSEDKLNHIKDVTNLSQSATTALQGSISDLLKKMENSSTKGKYSENILFNILHGLYPSAQIDYVGDHKECGDIMLVRRNKPSILIENKVWSKNVPQDEVKKFIRDVDTQKCCGLFLSQTCGIANKGNFELDMHHKNVLLYVHDVNNEAEKVRIAIDIIDNFKGKLDELGGDIDDGNHTINKEILDDISQEYQYFASQQMAQIKMVKEFSQKMIKQIEDVQLISLRRFLSTRYAFSINEHVCDVCGYVAKNQSALKSHKRGKKCKAQIEIVAPIETL